MSYLVLARKWRPKTFADTVGQDHVLKALVNALETGRLHHAYLFTGTRGVGKTTIARILAKALNCEAGVTAEPCGECSACKEIDEGRFVDLIEVDAASKTKVDDTRELLDNVQYAPARGRYKVYLIDEVHMLSTSSFNALLKTLEEPPPHVKFLLATTDPQKLPVTVLSRCLQFNLKRMTPRLIADRLQHISAAEDIEATPEALMMLARAADGSMRDSLSLLDQAIAYCGGSITEEPLALMLGTIDRNYVERLAEQLAEGNAAALLDTIREIDEHFPDYARLLDDLAALLQRVAVLQIVGQVDPETGDNLPEPTALADKLTPADVQLFYQTAIVGKRDLPLAPDPRSGAEMTLLRMLAFRPVDAGPADAVPTAPSGAARQAPANRTEAARPAPEKPAKSASAVAWQEPEWSALLPSLSLNGATRLLAGNCAYLRREADTVHLSLDPTFEAMLTRARAQNIAEALSTHFGEPIKVDIAMSEGGPETPHQAETRQADESIAAARQSLENDPNVRTMKSMFSAELKPDSIEIIPENGRD
jgi:DNA polymerase-3 subunit gamma/tau